VFLLVNILIFAIRDFFDGGVDTTTNGSSALLASVFASVLSVLSIDGVIFGKKIKCLFNEIQ
jgi:hypothetical protein